MAQKHTGILLALGGLFALASCGDDDTADGTGPTGGAGGGTSAPPTIEELVGAVTQAGYADDLTFIAQPREPGSAHHQAVQDLCASTFEELGLEVERMSYGSGVNVIGVLPGVLEPERSIIVSAHYDHISGCDGADDNATGTAGVLEAARALYSGVFAKSIVFACWDEEELGLIGAEAYADRVEAQGEIVDLMLSLEMIGYTSTEMGSQEVPAGFEFVFVDQVAQLEATGFVGDFITLVSDQGSAQFVTDFTQAAEMMVPVVNLSLTDNQKNNPVFADLRRSDHAPFWAKDIPAVMITDTSEFRNKNYHCIEGEDTRDTLDDAFATAVVQATVSGVALAAGIQSEFPAEN